MAFPLNGKDEGGIITSETFNLTRITTVLTGAMAAVAAIDAGGSSDEGQNWAGLTSGQRVILVVAAISAIAAISCADILARAVAVGKAEQAKVQLLPEQQPGKLKVGDNWVNGRIMAVRLGPTPQVLFCDLDAAPSASWRSFHEVQVCPRNP